MSPRLGFAEADGGEGAAEAELAAFLGRLVRWDKAAVVRLRSAAGEPALGVFGHPPFGGVLAVKSMALRGGGVEEQVEATVSAGELLETVAEAVRGGEFEVPRSVTGPAWAGLLPPRAGWRREAEFEGGVVRELAGRVVAEFRARTEALVPERRTRAELDGLAEELWRRPLPAGPAGTAVTLRVVHAAHALGFLPAEGRAEAVAVLSAGSWVRLRTAYGSVATRAASGAAGLSVSPV
ncbi:hypothetical protein ACFO3J_28590 [Streptomyces polygonati]|uniref:Uncharacterized protein n=1 Tax=Streptomyces polygonati TaxID=1617087 RepID=A0ABV8HWR2_9ACTN